MVFHRMLMLTMGERIAKVDLSGEAMPGARLATMICKMRCRVHELL